MYNFSSIVYRLVTESGLLTLVAGVNMLLNKPWKNGFKLKKDWFEILSFLIAFIIGIEYIISMLFPKITTFTGEFVTFHRGNRNSFICLEYVFENDEEGKASFYLDSFSKKEIFPREFEVGKEYTIFYDEYNDMIVKVEDNDIGYKTGDSSVIEP